MFFRALDLVLDLDLDLGFFIFSFTNCNTSVYQLPGYVRSRLARTHIDSLIRFINVACSQSQQHNIFIVIGRMGSQTTILEKQGEKEKKKQNMFVRILRGAGVPRVFELQPAEGKGEACGRWRGKEHVQPFIWSVQHRQSDESN